MRPRQNPGEALNGLLLAQSGVVSREQAMLFIPDRAIQRLVDQGHWRRLVDGVYTNRHEGLDFVGRAWSGVLAAGEGAMLGEHAAGHRLGICDEPRTDLTVFIPASRRREAAPGCRHVRRRSLPRPHGLLPVAPATDTVLDLCALEPARAEEWVTTAVRLRLTSADRLSGALARRARIRGGRRTRVMVNELLAGIEGIESVLERRYAVAVEGPHGIPPGERQYRRRAKRHDVRYDNLLVELDGKRGHVDPASVFRDMDRDNEAALEGLTTLRYGHADCWHRPCTVALQVHQMLRYLGINSGGHRCPSCPPDAAW